MITENDKAATAPSRITLRGEQTTRTISPSPQVQRREEPARHSSPESVGFAGETGSGPPGHATDPTTQATAQRRRLLEPASERNNMIKQTDTEMPSVYEIQVQPHEAISTKGLPCARMAGWLQSRLSNIMELHDPGSPKVNAESHKQLVTLTHVLVFLPPRLPVPPCEMLVRPGSRLVPPGAGHHPSTLVARRLIAPLRRTATATGCPRRILAS